MVVAVFAIVNGILSEVAAAPAAISQQAYLKPSNTRAIYYFGYRMVAISGDTIVVPANGESSDATGVNGDQTNTNRSGSGAVYVYVRNGTNWTQQAYLKASNPDNGDQFGYAAVATSGDTIVAGTWEEDSNATGVNGNQFNNSSEEAGAAYVFVRNGTNWSQQAYLKASNTGGGDWFGASVAVSGDTIVVGAFGESSNATGVNGNQADNSASDSGAAYVFVRSGTNWTQQAYLKASNTGAGDNFGNYGASVAISGDTIVIGAQSEDSNATGVNGNQSDNSASGAGAAYVFVRSGTNWTQQAYLKASNTEAGDSFGANVAVSGDTIVVTARGEDSGATGVNGNQNDNSVSSSGAAYVFVRDGTNWSQQAYIKASNPGATDEFGAYIPAIPGARGGSVAISGDVLVVGAGSEDSNATGVDGNQNDNSASDAGAAYVFVRSGTNWSQRAYLKASNTEANDAFGSGVAVSGETVVVTAWGEDSGFTGVNGNQNDNSASSSGAAYVFIGFTVPRSLRIEQSTGSSAARISWPAAPDDFLLEFTDTLSSPIWRQITSGIVTTENERSYVVDHDRVNGSGFFRLRRAAFSISEQPQSNTVFRGQSATFQVGVSGLGPFTYQWLFNGNTIPGATNSTFTVNNTDVANAGNYQVLVADGVDSVLSATAELTVLTAPMITQQPQDQFIATNGTAQFSVQASGAGTLTYQWRKDGTNIDGATASTLSVTNVQLENEGLYSVVASDANDSVGSQTARLVVLIRPLFVVQPVSQTVMVGDDVTFTASVTGNPLPFTFRWLRNGIFFLTNTVYSSNTSFTILNVQTNHAASYRVIVGNMALPSGRTSTNATLTVIP